MDVKESRKFGSFLPPLTDDEFAGLEQQILTHGCLSPIVVWDETGDLLDGYHRLKICKKHNLTYQIKRLSFADEDAALDWVADHQGGRRNLSALQRTYFLGRQYKKNVTHRGGVQDEKRENAAEILAEQKGISPATVVKSGQFAEAVDKIAAFSPKARTAIISGDADATVRDITAIAALPDKVVEAVAKELAEGATIEQVQSSVPAVKRQMKKIGQPIFDDRKISKAISSLVLAFEARSKLHGKTECYHECDKAIEALEKCWRQWLLEST